MRDAWSTRFVVVSPDFSVAHGFESHEGARTAALAFGDGASVVDTMAQPYHPALETVADGELAMVGFGAFDFRAGVDLNLIEAARKGHPALVRAFLAKGADANATDVTGANALLWGVAGGSADVLRILLLAGADPARPDRAGVTAADLALARNRADLFGLLSRASGAASARGNL